MDKNELLLPLILKSSNVSTIPGCKEMSERGGWSALFWNNHDQPRALNRFVDIKNFRNEGAANASTLASTCHVEHRTSTWAKKSA